MHQQLLNEIDVLIYSGCFDEAAEKLKDLAGKASLDFFQLLEKMKRLGHFHAAYLLLANQGVSSLRMEIEEAILQGELGALDMAIEFLKNHIHQLPNTERSPALFHLANFYSLKHQFQESRDVHMMMNESSTTSLQMLIADLNISGAGVYLRELSYEDGVKVFTEIHDRAGKEKFFLIQQGALYFLALLNVQAGLWREAKAIIENALSMKVQHRLRESLMLKILEAEVSVELGNQDLLNADLQRMVLGQDQVVYFDRYHFHRGKTEKALLPEGHAKVLWGSRGNDYDKKLRLIHAPQYWSMQKTIPISLTPIQWGRRANRRTDGDHFRLEDKTFLNLDDLTLQQRQIILQLSLRLEFGLRDVELWESVWGTRFSMPSSLDALQKAIQRINIILKPHVGFIRREQKKWILHVKPQVQFLRSSRSRI